MACYVTAPYAATFSPTPVSEPTARVLICKYKVNLVTLVSLSLQGNLTFDSFFQPLSLGYAQRAYWDRSEKKSWCDEHHIAVEFDSVQECETSSCVVLVFANLTASDQTLYQLRWANTI